MPKLNFGDDAAVATGSNTNIRTAGPGDTFPGQPVAQANSGVNDGTAASFQSGLGSNHVTNLVVDTGSNNDPDPFIVRDGEVFNSSFTYEGITFTDIDLTVDYIVDNTDLDPAADLFVGTLTGEIVVDSVVIPVVINVFPGASGYAGEISQDPTITSNSAQFICFGDGTLILTDKGGIPVERLEVGDRVRTLDNGFQPIRWIGRKTVTFHSREENTKLVPVIIKTGALAEDKPHCDLRISPNHRILLRSRIADRMFGASEVLVPAKRLVGAPGIEFDRDSEMITYYHILFERHEIIYSNGIETESLFIGTEALSSVDKEAREEIMSLFPDFAGVGKKLRPGRILADDRRGKKLVSRHLKNNCRFLGSPPST